MCLRTEQDYLEAVKDAEITYGPDHIKTGNALVALAEFYERSGLLDRANACDERIHEILEKFLSGE